MTGISTAMHLQAGVPWLLFEREDRLGGHARTDERDGYRFDKTGHWLHLRDAGVKQMVDELLPGQMVPYRAQGPNLLPRRADALPLPGESARPAARGDQGVPAGRHRSQAGDGDGAGRCPRTSRTTACATSAPGISKHFMIPYNEKIWGVHAARDHGGVVLALRAAAEPGAGGRGRGRRGAARDGLQPELPLPEVGRHRDVHARAADAAAAAAACSRAPAPTPSTGGGARSTVGGERIQYRALVATIPLPELLRRMPELPPEIETPGGAACAARRCAT